MADVPLAASHCDPRRWYTSTCWSHASACRQHVSLSALLCTPEADPTPCANPRTGEYAAAASGSGAEAAVCSSLPERAASTSGGPVGGAGAGAGARAGDPLLHIWVNGDMTVAAVRASMHCFVAAPAGRSWVLSRARGGPPLGEQESPQSLRLAEGDLLFAALDAGRCAVA